MRVLQHQRYRNKSKQPVDGGLHGLVASFLSKFFIKKEVGYKTWRPSQIIIIIKCLLKMAACNCTRHSQHMLVHWPCATPS